jgi:hypothetical protein
MLSVWSKRASEADTGPMHRKPGSSQAALHIAGKARAAAAATSATTASAQAACGGSGGGQAGGSAEPRGGAAAVAMAKQGAGRTSVEAPLPRRGTPFGAVDRERPRWADAGIPADAIGGGDGDSAYAEEDAAWEDWDGEGEPEAVEEPTPTELRARWQSECRVVRALEAQGVPADSAALAAARAARDDAEAQWRSKKQPQPLSVRMGWAQRKLDKAEQALSRARLELEEYEEEAARRRKEHEEKVEAADERYRLRQAQMEELHAEAGGSSAARANESLCTMVARELQAFTELLDEGSEVRGKANLLLAKLANAVGEAQPQSYNLAQDDADSDDEMGSDVHASAGCGEELGVPGTRARAQGATATSWGSDASGRWNRTTREARGGQHRSAEGGAAAQAGAEGREAATGGKPAPATPAEPAAPAPLEQPAGPPRVGRATRTREEEHQGPPPKSHRGEDDVGLQAVEAQGDDAARAAKLHQEQTIAMEMARAADAKFGDDASMQIAAQLYAHKVELAKVRAAAIGIGTTVGDKQLIELSPEQFNAWTRDTLAPAEEAAASRRA